MFKLAADIVIANSPLIFGLSYHGLRFRGNSEQKSGVSYHDQSLACYFRLKIRCEVAAFDFSC